jgi:hypothetical protein
LDALLWDSRSASIVHLEADADPVVAVRVHLGHGRKALGQVNLDGDATRPLLLRPVRTDVDVIGQVLAGLDAGSLTGAGAADHGQPVQADRAPNGLEETAARRQVEAAHRKQSRSLVAGNAGREASLGRAHPCLVNADYSEPVSLSGWIKLASSFLVLPTRSVVVIADRFDGCLELQQSLRDQSPVTDMRPTDLCP